MTVRRSGSAGRTERTWCPGFARSIQVLFSSFSSLKACSLCEMMTAQDNGGSSEQEGQVVPVCPCARVSLPTPHLHTMHACLRVTESQFYDFVGPHGQ